MTQTPDVTRPPVTTAVLRAAVALVWVLAGGYLLTDVLTGGPGFLGAGLTAVAAAFTVLTAERLGPAPPPWTDAATSRRYPLTSALRAATACLLRSSGWLLFAWSVRDGRPLGLPAAGDAGLVAQAVALVVGILLTGPRRARVSGLRLGFDAALSTLAVVLALWVLLVGPRTGYDLGRRDVLVVLGLCFLLLLQPVLVTLVVVREPVTHGPSAVLATGLLAATEVGVVVTAVTGGRSVPWALAVAWVAGWLLMTWSILWNRPLPGDLVPADVAERHEIRSTDVATGTVVVAAFVSVVGYATTGRGFPGGTAGSVVILVGICLFAARESLLGRLRARLTTQLRRQARIDPLTGLVNRRGLTERIRAIPAGAEWSVLALDLDGFKAVNDVHGHAAGDEVLVVVAEVLDALTPDAGVAARTGGDEFAVLAPGDIDAGRQLGHRIAAAVRDRLGGLGLGPRITVSVGVGRVEPVSALPAAPDRLVAVVEAAAALQAAKALGRDRVQVYPGLVARQRERRLLLEARLPQALADGSVTAVGQPIVDLRTGAVVAVEALARWDDDLLGQVPPAEFVVVAERSGLVPELGRCVLMSAVEGYRENGLVGSGLRLAVNVSPLELRGPGYIDGLAGVLARTGMPARDLVVEVTEAVVIEAGDPAVRVLSAINDLGVQVAIDDFGTGYSALGYLRRLPVQALKVDKSLVGEALTSVRTRQIVSGVVDLARRLGLVVTLEGIEDGDTARLAVDLGADQGQGYWFGRPVTWDLVALAASQEPPGAVAG